MEEIKVILDHAQAEITEKKSRFIANVYEIHSEIQANEYLDAIKKKHYDARHNCYAYVLGKSNETQRFSDDKEPQGTAGKPILEVIRGQGYHNTLIVVTRYFGGILLGTGGLLRAYTEAAQAGINQAEADGLSSVIYTGNEIIITSDYNLSGKIQYIINQLNIPLEDTIYDARVTYKLAVECSLKDMLIKKITEATNAASVISIGDPISFAISDNRPVMYEL